MSFTPVQTAILVDLLVHGDDKAGNIGNRTGRHRNTVSSHMSELVDRGLILPKGGGVYRLTDKGRASAQGLIKSGANPYSK